MGRRGPLPEDAKTYELRTGKRRYDTTPKPPPVAPDPPRGTSPAARCEWRRLVALLEPTGLLSRLDRDLLAAFCETVVLRRTAHAQLAAEGLTVAGYRGSKVKSPCWQVYRDATNMLTSLAKELGLSPAARVRMPIAPPPEEDDDPLGLLD